MSKDRVSILVANGSPPDVEVIKSTLSSSRADDTTYRIDTADSENLTIKKASGNNFDVLLVNQNSRGMDGIKMLKKISEKQLGMPVIMIVAEGEEKLGVKAMDKGAYDYLTREEIKTESLNRAIRRAIQRKKLENDIRDTLSKMERLAIKDGLTGLYNHNHFREVLKNEFKKAQRHLQPLSCIMLDLDYFKSVNDTHGHQFGDLVIVQSAEILKRLVRDTDFVARYGGEEFVILLPSTDLKGAYILAERVRVTFANNLFRKDGVSENVTVSMGISSTSDDNVTTDEDLVSNADRALYRAKWRGRNSVCTYEETNVSEEEHLREEISKIEEFNRRFREVNEKIKAHCIESAHMIFCEIEEGLKFINEHSIRVSRYAESLARELLMSEEEISIVRRAALLHDIGMIGIRSDILNKKDGLSLDEYDMIKKHSSIGIKIVERNKLFEKELPIILYHHERFDGKGYPHKLKGEAIPYGARILAIAEAYDAMLTNDSRVKACSTPEVISELRQCSGSQFDPHMVDTFLKVIENLDQA